METYITIREIYECIGELNQETSLEVTVDGWIKTNRLMGNVGFIEFNDGTYFRNAQLVYNTNSAVNFDEISKYKTGASIKVTGVLKLTAGQKQPFEIVLTKGVLIGDCDNDFPLQKKRHSFEYLREIAHLRPRSNTFNAVFRVRSVLSMAIHEFFQNEGFVYVHTPIFTGQDCEGAGEMFKVATDFAKPDEFFGKTTGLTVSGQLHVEPFAMAFRDVYTFGPTFRAENSNTSRHASEFWMIEPEIAFADLFDDMDLMEDFLKYVVKYVVANCSAEMEFFNEMIDKTLMERLNKFLETKIQTVTYTDGIDLLKKAVSEGQKFDYSKIKWGMDLQSEHERYLTEVIVKGPMFLINYPKEIKSFYMKQNDDGKTVAAVDLLVPLVGELCGGSQREENYDLLKSRMEELKMNIEEYQWYLDLRKYGGCPHAGFGVGFDRLMVFITGISNIRDVLPYPRTPKNLLY